LSSESTEERIVCGASETACVEPCRGVAQLVAGKNDGTIERWKEGTRKWEDGKRLMS
jgi:hypothetical protein